MKLEIDLNEAQWAAAVIQAKERDLTLVEFLADAAVLLARSEAEVEGYHNRLFQGTKRGMSLASLLYGMFPHDLLAVVQQIEKVEGQISDDQVTAMMDDQKKYWG